MSDPGTAWHPSRPDAYDEDGNLRDLTDLEVRRHRLKIEAGPEYEEWTPREAESSETTPDGVV